VAYQRWAIEVKAIGIPGSRCYVATHCGFVRDEKNDMRKSQNRISWAYFRTEKDF